MPKGQYDRKPKSLLVEPEASGVVFGVADVSLPPLGKPAVLQPEPQGTVVNDPPLTADPPLPPVAPAFAAAPTDDFDAWVNGNEGMPSASVPYEAPSHVTMLVNGWAGTVCPGSFTVTWLPTKDGDGLEVTLTTEHGTSQLSTPLEGWSMEQVATGLERLRAELFPEPAVSPEAMVEAA